MNAQIDNVTLSFIFIPISLVYSLLILLIWFHFHKHFKGASFWFLSMVLPVLAFSYASLNLTNLSDMSYYQTNDMVVQIAFIIIFHLVGNLFLETGWRSFFREKRKIF
ncbi:MAG: hypothetical protein PF518_14370, partial [Spirochaetaceae bacterium]|nr:hypothetical protein [Spirochaetaceae bacterium]